MGTNRVQPHGKDKKLHAFLRLVTLPKTNVGQTSGIACSSTLDFGGVLKKGDLMTNDEWMIVDDSG